MSEGENRITIKSFSENGISELCARRVGDARTWKMHFYYIILGLFSLEYNVCVGNGEPLFSM
jgi:hypothetical protein